MKELVIATQNKKKLEEIREILKGLDLNITSLVDYSFSSLPKIALNFLRPLLLLVPLALLAVIDETLAGLVTAHAGDRGDGVNHF